MRMSKELEQHQLEISRLNKIIDVLTERAEQGINNESSDFSLFQTAITLEEQVRTRTEELNTALGNLTRSNLELDLSLNELNHMQQQLVESAKMASLGHLVAGVAHELNTPIGVCITGASCLAESTKKIGDVLNNNKMTKSSLTQYIGSVSEITNLVATNLTKASSLISHFKQASVDAAYEEIAAFNLYDHLQKIVSTLSEQLATKHIKVNIICPSSIVIDSYAGVFSQILRSLLINSLFYGYDKKNRGCINIQIQQKVNQLTLVYQDDGRGMSKAIVNNIFEPFFTTNRNKGGTGLDMFIFYNLITQKLGGEVTCSSELDKGVIFKLNLPNLKITNTVPD
mgnify:CR=1 FL=1